MATLTANITADLTLIPLSAEVENGYYSIDSENIYVTGMSRGAEGREFTRRWASVDRGVGGSTPATHNSAATLTRYYPDAKAGTGGGGVIVDNTVDAPFEATTLIAPGAQESGPDEATLTSVLTVFSQTVTLTDAQIKAMRSSPVPVVAPTEVLGYVGSPTEVFVPVMAFAFLDTMGGAYDNAPVPMHLRLVWGADISISVTTATNKDGPYACEQVFETAGTKPDFFFVFPPARQEAAFLQGNLQDNGLYLAYEYGQGGENSVGDLTGGNASNSMSITVYYTVVTVP